MGCPCEMDPLTLQVLRRYTHKQGGVFEAPPGMFEDIYEWAVAVVAANEIASSERALEGNAENKQKYLEKLAELERLCAALEANPTNWKAYVALYDATWMFGHPGSRWNVKEFQKLTPERKAALQERVGNYVAAIRERASGDPGGYDRVDRDFKAEIARLQRFTRPGVSAMTGDTIKRSFDVNLTGWKYGDALIQQKIEQRVKEQSEVMLKMFGQLPDTAAFANTIERLKEQARTGKGEWGQIWVELTTKEVKGMAAAWNQFAKRVFIILPRGAKPYNLEDLAGKLRHELQHFSQDFFAYILGGDMPKFKPGLPSKRIRTPEYKQHLSPTHPSYKPDDPETKALIQRLRTQGIRVEQVNFHDLDDVEFYTELADAIDDFKQRWTRVKADIGEEGKKVAIRFFVGITLSDADADFLNKSSENHSILTWFSVNRFFSAIRTRAPGKYRKALTEFVKAVL